MNAADEAVADAFAHEWVAAFNSHDLDRILSHYADDVVLVSPLAVERLGRANGEVRGKRELRDYLARSLQPGSLLRFSLRRCYRGVASIVLEYDRHDQRQGAEFMELDAEGRVRSVVAHYADRKD
ncbi:MAG: nuclear transport factor 2 family protein [Methylocystis sp.]